MYNIPKFLKFVILFALVGSFGMIFTSGPIYAQYYGQGGSSTKIVVDKMVRPISDSVFYDNIDPSKKIFSPLEMIEFKIVVENTSNVDLVDVTVIDKLPEYFSLIFYPGVYNSGDRSIIAKIAKLSPGEKKVYLVRGKIDYSKAIEAKLQQTNLVRAFTDRVSDSDEAKYFIALTSIPNTGFGDIEIRSILATMLLALGFGIRKRVRGY